MPRTSLQDVQEVPDPLRGEPFVSFIRVASIQFLEGHAVVTFDAHPGPNAGTVSFAEVVAYANRVPTADRIVLEARESLREHLRWMAAELDRLIE